MDSSNRERKKTVVAVEEIAPSACSIEAMRNGTTCESCQ